MDKGIIWTFIETGFVVCNAKMAGALFDPLELELKNIGVVAQVNEC